MYVYLIHRYTYVCMFTHICVYTYTCMYIYIYIYIYVYIYIHTTHTHTLCIYVYALNIYIYICMYIYTYIYMYAHTRTHTWRVPDKRGHFNRGGASEIEVHSCKRARFARLLYTCQTAPFQKRRTCSFFSHTHSRAQAHALSLSVEKMHASRVCGVLVKSRCFRKAAYALFHTQNRARMRSHSLMVYAS